VSENAFELVLQLEIVRKPRAEVLRRSKLDEKIDIAALGVKLAVDR
jgi:hypothetical protein